MKEAAVEIKKSRNPGKKLFVIQVNYYDMFKKVM